MVTNCLFLPNHVPKMPQSQQLFFGLLLVSRIFQHPAIQIKIVQPFGGFSQQNKSVPANRKTGFYTNLDPNKQEVASIFV
jgi:hypothetical protein